MNPIRARKSLYLDTMGFIYAQSYLARPVDAPDRDYFTVGAHYIRCLEKCREKSIRVFSTDLAYLEMHHNYHEWAWYKQALEQGAPPGLIFSKSRRMDQEFWKQPLTPEAHKEVLAATVHWLETWEFKDLIEFRPPEEIPNWFLITRRIYAKWMETVLDCLHLAAAIALECNFFLTQDQPLRELIVAMRQDKAFREELQRDLVVSEDYALPDAVKAQTFNPK
jgi:hypothetical protein